MGCIAPTVLCAGFCNVMSLGPLGSFFEVKFHFLSFSKRFVSLATDGGIVDKNVFAPILFDEAKTFCIIKPFNASFGT